jgi:uncharacterized membrane protein YbhN (UPF0104 family)
MQTSSRKLVAVLIGLLVLGFVVYRSSGMLRLGDFSGTRLLQAVRNANPFLLILSVVAIYGCYAIRSLRWKVFQQNLGPSHFATIYGLTLAGFSAIFLLGRAGEPVRPLLLARKEKLPISGMFGIYVLERLFDLASAAVIAAIGLLLFKSNAQSGGVLHRGGRLHQAHWQAPQVVETQPRSPPSGLRPRYSYCNMQQRRARKKLLSISFGFSF